jgi:hypothetical protein
MSSERQRESARINGAKARGPKTAEGKRISALNATRRSLLAKTLLIEGESPRHFEALLSQIIQQFQPLPGHEMSLAESMACARWRQLRAMAMQTEILSHEIRNHREVSSAPLSALGHAAFAARNLTDNSRILTALVDEQAHCELQYSRAHASLLKSISTRAHRFHPVEPGVPEPLPAEPVEIPEPPA